MDIVAHIDAALFVLAFCSFAGSGFVAASAGWDEGSSRSRTAVVAALFVLGSLSLCGMALTFTQWDYVSH
jgi:hypothetical protein